MMRSFAGFGAGVVLEEFLDQHVAADHADEDAVAHDWHVFEFFAIHVLSDFAQVFVCFCCAHVAGGAGHDGFVGNSIGCPYRTSA